jgi:hypothetical protein
LSPRALIRYEQVRRRGEPDVQASDAPFTEGRYFDASCLTSAAVNDCVKVVGTNGGGRPKVRLCDPNDPSLMPMTGIVVQKYSPMICLVQVSGLTITLPGLVAGEPYFVGPSGGPVTPEPVTLKRQLIGVAIGPQKLLLYPNQAPVERVVDEIFGEEPIGAVDGTNRVYSTTSPFLLGTLRVYLNGIRQKAGTTNDYSVLSSSSFEFVRAPRIGDLLLLDYKT